MSIHTRKSNKITLERRGRERRKAEMGNVFIARWISRSRGKNNTRLTIALPGHSKHSKQRGQSRDDNEGKGDARTGRKTQRKAVRKRNERWEKQKGINVRGEEVVDGGRVCSLCENNTNKDE